MVLIPGQGLGIFGIFLFRPLTISPLASYIGNLQISPLCTFPSVHLTSTTSPGPFSLLSRCTIPTPQI